jgi:hypothetical protein
VAALAQDRPCDAAEHPVAQMRMAIGAHDDEIGAESGACDSRRRPMSFPPDDRDDFPSAPRNEFLTKQKSICCISSSELKITLEK